MPEPEPAFTHNSGPGHLTKLVYVVRNRKTTRFLEKKIGQIFSESNILYILYNMLKWPKPPALLGRRFRLIYAVWIDIFLQGRKGKM